MINYFFDNYEYTQIHKKGDMIKNIEVEKGISLEELYRKYEEELPYTVLLAKVDNKLEELNHKLHRSCTVEFLDMRT